MFSGISEGTLIFMERFGWWGHIIGVLIFLNYIPHSKHLHIFLAFPNTYFARLTPKGELKHMPEVTKEVAPMFEEEEEVIEATPVKVVQATTKTKNPSETLDDVFGETSDNEGIADIFGDAGESEKGDDLGDIFGDVGTSEKGDDLGDIFGDVGTSEKGDDLGDIFGDVGTSEKGDDLGDIFGDVGTSEKGDDLGDIFGDVGTSEEGDDLGDIFGDVGTSEEGDDLGDIFGDVGTSEKGDDLGDIFGDVGTSEKGDDLGDIFGDVGTSEKGDDLGDIFGDTGNSEENVDDIFGSNNDENVDDIFGSGSEEAVDDIFGTKEKVVEKVVKKAPEPVVEEEEIIKFGASDVFDLSWKNLLDAYTCTECGRCTSMCPANITGKKLSPRKVMMDVRDRADEIGRNLDAKTHTRENYDDGKNLFDFITKEELHACTTCNACVEACPVMINPLDIIVELRRNLILDKADSPEPWSVMFTNIENNGAPWQFSASDRAKWIEEIK